ncbi:HTH_Tnp_Tc3_2 domain-containing protein [Nephila pilipes]|uniref:HTH_Tnp_Tc3_2 domain-containing protein n=1 Tax=Nephila pilipes TaxID=299642 RepID=A0A8X6N2G7_NEPPI|nr:HTH_Tnp_Tc3_2 domain-containing protein [Nephila pilipes]
MGRKTSEIAYDIRKFIIHHWNRKNIEKKIDEILKVSKSLIQSIISKYKKTRILERAGHPKRFVEHKERCIVRNITTNPKPSAVKLTKERVRGLESLPIQKNFHICIEKVYFSWASI